MAKVSGIAVGCGVGGRCGSDLALLWLWHRLAAVVPIRPLGWEHPHATGVLKGQKKKKEKAMCPHLTQNFSVKEGAYMVRLRSPKSISVKSHYLIPFNHN